MMALGNFKLQVFLFFCTRKSDYEMLELINSEQSTLKLATKFSFWALSFHQNEIPTNLNRCAEKTCKSFELHTALVFNDVENLYHSR